MGSRRIVSQAQRYEEMVASLHRRVTAGKSAIHGYGAFAKLSHKAGEDAVFGKPFADSLQHAAAESCVCIPCGYPCRNTLHANAA